jgi:hypothetical protein
MLIIYISAIIVWLTVCGLILNIDMIKNFSFDLFGFTFGIVWGQFATSWAIFYISQPAISSFGSFCQTLEFFCTHAPILYTWHGFC